MTEQLPQEYWLRESNVSSALKRTVRSILLRRLIALILLGGGFPLLVLAYLSATYSSESMIRQWDLLQTEMGQSVSSVVSSHVQGCVRQLAVLEAGLRDASGHVDIQSLMSSGTRGAFGSLSEQGGVLSLRVLDANGNGAQIFDDFRDQASADVVDSTIAAALHSERPIVSRPAFSGKLDELVFAVGMPLFNGGARAGALLGVFSLEPVLRSLRQGSWFGVQVLIADRSGSLVASLDRNRILKSSDYRENEVIKFLMTNAHELGAVTRRFVASREGNSIPMIGTGVPIPGTNWVAIAEIPQSEAYAEAGANMRKLLTLAFALLLLAIGGSAAYCYRLARPMAQLAESVRQITAGDDSVEPPCDDNSEAGIVSRVFRDMSEQARQNLAQLKLAVEDSKQLLTGIIRALASAIDAKDPYTRGHSERVTRFAVEIAKLMGLPEEEIERTRLGALIHDVGKITVEDRILKKPSALSDEEFRVMKTHAARGYEMMKHIPQLNDILPGIHSHHEHLDGKGYPQGLKGDEIPMIARVIMVADCFDAMTTKRPHQDPAPIDQVLAEIRSLSGKTYDEKVVEALVRGVKTGQIIPHLAA